MTRYFNKDSGDIMAFENPYKNKNILRNPKNYDKTFVIVSEEVKQ
jgi:hypothetical protein